MKFWNIPYFWKTFLDQSLWIFNMVRRWCHTLTIYHTYQTWKYEILKYPLFAENISWPVLMNIQKDEMMMSCPHNFVHVSIRENDKNLIFRHDNVNCTFYPPKINEELHFLWHISIKVDTFTYIWQKNWYLSQFHVWCVWYIVRVWHHYFSLFFMK